MRLRLFLTILSFGLTAATAFAALPAGLIDTFKPVDGVIVKFANNEILVDLGSDNGVRQGDLLTVLAPGETITHPLTGQKVGQIDRARAWLRAERVKPDFSWARPLSQTLLKAGEPVRRYGEVPAVFIDERGDGHPVFSELQLALPHLAWKAWGETTLTGPGLRFQLQFDRITVRDERNTLIGEWALSTPAPAAGIDNENRTGSPLTMVGPPLKGKSVGIALGDFDGDKAQEIAVALEESLLIGRLNKDGWKDLLRLPVTGARRALTLDSADINDDGRDELLLTTLRGNALSSLIYSCNNGDCRILADNLPWSWRVLDLPGKRRVILAQKDGPRDNRFYSGTPFKVLWKEGAPVIGPDFPLPPGILLHGSQIFSTGSELLWAGLDRSDDLQVINGVGKRIWVGSQKFGGSEIFVDYKFRGDGGQVERTFLRSRLGLYDSLIIAPQNDGPRTMKNWRHAEKSRLVALRWNGYRLEPVWKSPEREGSLADFAVGDVDNDGDTEFVMTGRLSTGLFGADESAIFIWMAP